MSKKYVAYVGSYTNFGKSKGITILDADVESGRLTKRKEVTVNNSSYLTFSYDRRFLYSIVDEGVASFKILPDGDLEHLNTVSIRGIRTCYITVDRENRYMITSGYHDGKMTVLNINPDGSVGSIASEVFNHGYGSVAERNFRPHITCAQFTPDQNFICMVDMGLDSVKLYRLNRSTGELRLVDIIHCELNSGPRYILFSDDGRHMYMVSQLKNYITVYNYIPDEKSPKFEFKQLVSTLPKGYDGVSAACALRVSPDYTHVFCTNAGDNSIAMYDRNEEDGLLYKRFILPVSGDYPKELEIFPDSRHLISVNHDSGTLTFFKLDYEKGLMSMSSLPLKIDNPNCCKMMPLTDD